MSEFGPRLSALDPCAVIANPGSVLISSVTSRPCTGSRLMSSAVMMAAFSPWLLIALDAESTVTVASTVPTVSLMSVSVRSSEGCSTMLRSTKLSKPGCCTSTRYVPAGTALKTK